MRFERYQYALIFLGIVSTVFLIYFLLREIYPEYKIYQNNYVALENFRSTYISKEPPPEFQKGIKQIVLERDDKGPPIIDRCTSCHVALDIPYFSPTKIARDINNNIIRDAHGTPVQVPNEDYIWKLLDQKIDELTAAGNKTHDKSLLQQAERLRGLKTAQVGDHVYDVTKVLASHPLIGKETHPFEFHNVDEYGCTSCHNGNGRGLTTEKAHGPVFDGYYEIEYKGPKQEFTEIDKNNDPLFAKMFNNQPGPSMVFQTTPIFVGALIQAKCVQCHMPSDIAFQDVVESGEILTKRSEKYSNAINEALEDEKKALLTIIDIRSSVMKDGIVNSLEKIKQKMQNYSLSQKELDQLAAQEAFLKDRIAGKKTEADKQEWALAALDQEIITMVGSSTLAQDLENALKNTKESRQTVLEQFLVQHHQDPQATGTIFKKWISLNLEQELLHHVEDTQTSLEKSASDEKVVSGMTSDIDFLTKNYHRGLQLYISQACYACHRIAGLSRGNVGPELTREGNSYPWFVKQSIVWPQAELKTATMPNYSLDHIELQDLVTFLLGQKGENKAVSPIEYSVAVKEWEGGRQMPWEKPIPPSKIHNVRYAMTVFATEGCAACHRLQGFESNVGFSIEKGKEKPGFEALYQQRQWFSNLFPESIIGSQIVQAIDANTKDIDERIVDGVRQNSILEEIERKFPQTVEAYYSNFRFASRAKNHDYKELADKETDPVKKKQILSELEQWKQRVHRILMIYVQEYGLGRLIGPRPNWSGIFRSDEWLMEHFRNPTAHTPRSIMPAFPFDDSKFYSLTYMLDVLAKRNRDAVHAIWKNNGFNPEQAFHIHCSQCHGDYLQGNGPVSVWIYPLPKNLRNADFLRNLTKENAIQSITHGVKGTPMPPWGETPSDKPTADGIPVLNSQEIRRIVDWIYSSLPGSTVIHPEEVPKWQYTPQDVLKDLQREGNELKAGPELEEKESSSITPPATLPPIAKVLSLPPELNLLPTGEGYYAALQPTVSQSVPDKNQEASESVADIFDIFPNPIPGPEKDVYYIKKKYYTEENIDAGKQFFELNCSICHGAEADGTGLRAQIMQDAKPRMLTNLDWLNTRDDLRLIRSIKYGVPGTAMIPWGDLTNSLQRLQLVIFIRSLSQEQEQRDKFASDLYKIYDNAQIQVENARIASYPPLEKAQNDFQKLKSLQNKLYEKVQIGKAPPKEALDTYQQELDLLVKLRQYREVDQLLLSLKDELRKEGSIYRTIGNSLIGKEPEKDTWDLFLKLLALNNDRFTFADGKLSLNSDPKKESERKSLENKISEEFDAKIAALEKENIIITGRIASANRNATLDSITKQINSLSTAKRDLLSGLEQANTVRQKQIELFKQYQEKKTNFT
jgi:mono/diheme cytochrome c family protein